jgi:hypothetical protein
MLFKFAFEYAVKNFQENKERLEFNMPNQLLAYVDVISLLGGNKLP